MEEERKQGQAVGCEEQLKSLEMARAGGTERKCPYLILEVACGHWLGLEVRPRGQPAGSPGPSSQAASILGTLPKCSQVSLMESESRGWETRER